MDAAEDKLKRMVKTHFPNYIDRYERLENMLETNIKQPLKGVDFRKILNTADGLAAGFRTINIVTNSQIYQDNLAEIKKIKNLEPPYDSGDWDDQKRHRYLDKLQDQNEKLLIQDGQNFIELVRYISGAVPLITPLVEGMCDLASAILETAVGLIQRHNRNIDEALNMLAEVEAENAPNLNNVKKKVGSNQDANRSIQAFNELKQTGVFELNERLTKNNNVQKWKEQMEEVTNRLDTSVHNLNRSIQNKVAAYNRAHPDAPMGTVLQYGDSYSGADEAYKASNEAVSLPKSDPLVLDLQGDGIKTTSVNHGVYFDLDHNGFAEKTAWFSSEDGILVLDRNGNGVVDNGGELFGDRSVLSNGRIARSGFEALADFDKNQDRQIDEQDAIYHQLRVWKDLDQDGYSEANELFTLSELGIANIGLVGQSVTTTDENGNQILRQGFYTTASGNKNIINEYLLTGTYIDVQEKDVVDVSGEIAALPNLKSRGIVRSLHQAMQRDESGDIKQLLESFMAETSRVNRDKIFKNLLERWTGSDTSELSTQEKELRILDKLTGGKLLQGIDQRTTTRAYEMLYQAYGILYRTLYAELMIQTHFKPYIYIDFEKWTLETNIDKLISDLEEQTSPDYVKLDALREAARVLMGLEGAEGINYQVLKRHFEGKGSLYARAINNVYGNYAMGEEANQSLVESKGNYYIVGTDAADQLRGKNIMMIYLVARDTTPYMVV